MWLSNAVKIDVGVIAMQMRWYNPSLERWLHRITVPTLIMWGKEDKLFPSATTPTESKRHARQHRGADLLPSSSSYSGRFGRMFRNLPVFEVQLSSLTPLAELMIPAAGASPSQP